MLLGEPAEPFRVEATSVAEVEPENEALPTTRTMVKFCGGSLAPGVVEVWASVRAR
jgi:hypothetical protein